VVLVDDQLVVRYLNPSAENLFATSSRKIVGYSLRRLLGEPAGLECAQQRPARQLELHRPQPEGAAPGMETLHLDCTVTPVEVSMRACCSSFARWTPS
jgi:two-component system nitrogen regulation sensor histidine kinase GlnL